MPNTRRGRKKSSKKDPVSSEQQTTLAASQATVQAQVQQANYNMTVSQQNRRSLSRHRDSISSNNTSISGLNSIYSGVSHVDENETEMFSGAAANVVPTAVSSFHHHHHPSEGVNYRSPSMSSYRSPVIGSVAVGLGDGVVSRGSGSGAIDDFNLDEVIGHADGGFYQADSAGFNADDEVDNDEEDGDLGLYPVQSNLETRNANFRFFTTQQIEDAKGVSTLQRINTESSIRHGAGGGEQDGQQGLESVVVDYDTNWNTYADDYTTDNEEAMPLSPQYPLPRHPHALAMDRGYGSVTNSQRSSRVGSPEYRNDEEEELEAYRMGMYDEDADESGLVGHGRGLDAGQGMSSHDEFNDDDYNPDGDHDGKAYLLSSRKRADVDQHDRLFGSRHPAKRHNQRFYIAEEDLVVGFAGYKTSKLRLVAYYLFIVFTLGLGYLVLRWFPRYMIKMMGDEVPLGKAEWVVIEDEFGVLDIQKVDRLWYNKRLSSFLLPKQESDVDGEEKKDDEDGKYNEEEDGKDDCVNPDDTYRDNLIRNADPVVPVLIMFEYRYMTLFYDPVDDLYRLANSWSDDKWCYYPDIKDGISEEIFKSRLTIFGLNMINIKEKSVMKLLTDEILHPFYVFQIFSIFLWFADDYYYYAFCIFIISMFSVADSLVETKKNMKRMRDLSKFQCAVRVWRNGFWTETTSDLLVPGDVYEVSDPSLSVFPCDSILLSGDCIVNEAMLTGESVPVSKVPITPEAAKCLKNEFSSAKFSNTLSRSFLYNGTKIVRCRYGADSELATALVVRTGFNTTKGSLIRSMLFPKPSGFKFYEDSFKYIGVMFLVACVGFTYSTYNFIRLGLDWKIITFRALDLITIVVPPALPATLTIGTSFALSRLRKKQIFCIAPTRVNVGGKLDVMCFDKTGTLTEEGLDIMGVHVSQPIKGRQAHEFSGL
ncbi:unnamed protein product [Ambrosiozyma monospora]|uniref:Cation-transporting ATPase n=1 Tax=Ambrosiozyma monospora TaxID=43982 RepID=A0A9W7DI48_AMBMO|nr:unnamed protein product [Ambrosiozyma monospora]